ncbi:MAG: AMP-binding protein, partial [Yaniella sp.]|nr:AMP-binding protein [Yaniella sp.]
MSVTAQYRQARDVLLTHRTDIEAARKSFDWPRFENFNFALDWFDKIAASEERADQDVLVILEEDGTRYSATYAELSARSSQVANWLRNLGVKRGDGIIIMLDNQYELWETMLAGFKLGAVLLPTTVMLGPEQIDERITRSEATWVVTNP